MDWKFIFSKGGKDYNNYENGAGNNVVDIKVMNMYIRGLDEMWTIFICSINVLTFDNLVVFWVDWSE